MFYGHCQLNEKKNPKINWDVEPRKQMKKLMYKKSIERKSIETQAKIKSIDEKQRILKAENNESERNRSFGHRSGD